MAVNERGAKRMNMLIVAIRFSLGLVCAISPSHADQLQIPFSKAFDGAIVRTVYGEADHSIDVRWTANTISVSTDLYGGRTVSDFNATNRYYLLQVLEAVYREQTVALEDSCYRTWVQATFYRGKEALTRRACLLPARRGLAKKVVDFFRVATLAM
jgi:hypothetical protein